MLRKLSPEEIAFNEDLTLWNNAKPPSLDDNIVIGVQPLQCPNCGVEHGKNPSFDAAYPVCSGVSVDERGNVFYNTGEGFATMSGPHVPACNDPKVIEAREALDRKAAKKAELQPEPRHVGQEDPGRVGADFQHSLPPQPQPDASLVLVARHLILEALKEKPAYFNVVREARAALAELEKASPAHDVLTGGASLRDYFAAQALRSHYIIGLTSGKSMDFLIDLIFEIGDRSALRAQIPPPTWKASPPPTASPDTPPATEASRPNRATPQREDHPSD